MTQTIVVGAGIAGLVIANLIKQAKPEQPLILIEREDEVGGLLRSLDYGPAGRFDYGTHMMFETGISPLDQLLFNLLPPNEWQILAGNQRDLAGSIFHNHLQTNSPYPDLRTLPEDMLRQALADFFFNLKIAHAKTFSTAYDYATAVFGPEITNTIIRPIVKKIFDNDLVNLTPLALRLAPLERVVLFDEAVFLALMEADPIRQKLAFPEQRHLPAQYASGKQAYYPKQYGMFRVIDALRQRLEAADGQILTNCTVTSVVQKGNTIQRLAITQQEQSFTIDSPLDLYWTAGLPVLTHLLSVTPKTAAPDFARKTVIVSLLVDQPLAVGDLYYFYCFDARYLTFRVTCFSNYCPEAYRAEGFPISMELLIDPKADYTQTDLIDLAISELQAFNVLPPNAKILFSQVEILARGFPLPTVNNSTIMDAHRTAIKRLYIENLTCAGILSEPNLFFQTEILADLYGKVQHNLQNG